MENKESQNTSKKTNERFLNVSEPIKVQMDDAALSIADSDLYEIFSSIFSVARQIAAEKQSKASKLSITESIWTEAKWRTIIKWGFKKQKSVWAADILLVLSPVLGGWSLNDLSAHWGWMVLSVVFIAGSVIFKIYKELVG